MDRFAELTGRHYRLFDYEGAPDAERVIVMMGSGAEAAAEAVAALNAARRTRRPAEGAAVPAVQRRALRARAAARRCGTSPCSIAPRSLARWASRSTWTWSPPSASRPATTNAPFRFFPRIIGGRYGLGSKEFTPAMAGAVFDELADATVAALHFTVGIDDDVSLQQPAVGRGRPAARRARWRAVFYGLGCRRHRRRQQELDQDHRRRDRPLRAGLLRLRLEEVGLD